jgi:REP element-mobilizing transposase RayT
MNDYPLDDYGFEKYETSEFPLAYFITIRTFGTWLHGDERYSVERHGKNVYGTDKISPHRKLNEVMQGNMKKPSFVLNTDQRSIVEIAIRELCEERNYFLHAVNVRSNHVHTVVSAQAKPERLADAFKASATKKLREANLVSRNVNIWSRGRSRRYLWKPRNVEQAIDYVLYSQGDDPFVMDEDAETRTE